MSSIIVQEILTSDKYIICIGFPINLLTLQNCISEGIRLFQCDMRQNNSRAVGFVFG